MRSIVAACWSRSTPVNGVMGARRVFHGRRGELRQVYRIGREELRRKLLREAEGFPDPMHGPAGHTPRPNGRATRARRMPHYANFAQTKSSHYVDDAASRFSMAC
jgi:hypothetical protein